MRNGPQQAEAELRRVHAEVLHVSPGGDHLGGLDLVREDAGVLADFLHALLLGEQSVSGVHVQRREYRTDLEIRDGQLSVLPQTDASVPGLSTAAEGLKL